MYVSNSSFTKFVNTAVFYTRPMAPRDIQDWQPNGMLCFKAVTLFLALTAAAIVPKPLYLTPMSSDLNLNGTLLQGASSTGLHPLGGVFYYQIYGTSIVLWLTITGDRLPFTDINTCLQYFGFDVIRQITMHGERALSIPRTYSHALVTVAFTPQRMTWVIAGEVADALETIIATGHWRWASHVTVVDANVGVVGYLGITHHVQEEVAASSLAKDRSQPTQPASGNSNLTSGVPQSKPRPSSPYPYVIPGSQISVICDEFGGTLPSQVVYAILFGGQIFVSQKIRQQGPLAPVNNLPPWGFRDVVLEVNPSDRLRWADLSTALDGLLEFVDTFDTFAFTFEIRYQGFRSLGSGRLGLKS